MSGLTENQIPTIFHLNPPSNPPLRALTDSYALSSTCPPFAFGSISTPDPVGIPEGYPQRWVGTPTAKKRHNRELPWQTPLGSSPPSRSDILPGTGGQAHTAIDSLCESGAFMDDQGGASR